MSGRNSHTGRTAQLVGQRSEDAVAAMNATYRAHGRARVTKRATPFRQIRPMGDKFVGVRTAPSGVDFGGCLAGGRHVAFDVKRSGSASLPLKRRNGKPTLTPPQEAELRWVDEAGGVAGVLVCVTPRVAGRLVPWWFWMPFCVIEDGTLAGWPAAVAVAERHGAKSLSVGLLGEFGVALDGPDWLRAALECSE